MGDRKQPKHYFVNPFKVSPFLKLLTKRQGASTVRSKQWALKIIAEVYDARFQALKDPHWRRIRTASFVHELLSRRYGVKSIVDKMCWELYQTIQKLRMEDKELDIFGWFLDELFDGDDLTFFVEARQKVLWSQEVDKEDMVQMSALALRPDAITGLVNNIFGNGAPTLSDRVIDRVNHELSGRSLTVSNFLDVALEEFRLHFDKPFPKIEAMQDLEPEPPAVDPPAQPYADESGYNAVPPMETQKAALSQPRQDLKEKPAVQAPLQPRDGTVSEWQFPLIVELREQLVKKNQRVYELEEKLLAQGEGRAKVESQLRQLKHQAAQMNRDASSEREWVEQFLRDAGYGDAVSQGGGDYGAQLMMVFEDKQAQIDELLRDNQNLEERAKMARSAAAGKGDQADELLRLQHQNMKLHDEVGDLSAALRDAEAEREKAILNMEQAQASAASQGVALPAPQAVAGPASHRSAAKPDSPGRGAPAASPPSARSQHRTPRSARSGTPPRSERAASSRQTTARGASSNVTSPERGGGEASYRSSGGGSAMGGAGADDKTSNMLTQVINELEKKARVDKQKCETMAARVKELEREFERETLGRNQAEEAVVLLEEESKALRHDLEAAKGMLSNLETQEASRFEAAIAEERAQHGEEIAKMKTQMSAVMEKVMKEWERVKKAAKKSVSVEEWLRLEDELKRAEKKNEELMALGGGGGGDMGGGGGGGKAIEAADPEVYGKAMADVVDNIEKKTKALRLHGDNWRAHGDVANPAEEEMKKAVGRLYARYDQLEHHVLALDTAVEKLAEEASKGQIPEAVVDRLARVIKDGLAEMRSVRDVKAAPEEIVVFMEKVVQLSEELQGKLENAEGAFHDKAMAVIEAERNGRLNMQEEVSKLRAAIKSVPESLRPKVFSPEFLSWFQ